MSQNPFQEDMGDAVLTPFMNTVPKGKKPKDKFTPTVPKKQFITPKGKSK